MSRSRKRRAAAAPPVPAKRRGGGFPFGMVLVVLIAAAFAWHAWGLQFTQDDAYISLRYARNLVEGEGLVFNPGERVEGYSNFTWTLLLALFLKLGAPAVETSRWLGIAFGVLAVLTAGRLGRGVEGRWGAASVGAAALVAGNPAFALWSTGGLETALYTFLVTVGLERGLAPGVGPRGRLLAPILLCLAALSRPDGPLVFALWFALRVVDTLRGEGPLARPDGFRGLVRDAVLFTAPLVPYAIWKLIYYGDLLPNTYYAKAGVSAVYLSRGVEYALDWFRSYGLGGVAPVLAAFAVAHRGIRGVEVRLLAVWLGVGAYIVAIGGDVLYLHRFWLPILPIGAVLVARGTTWLAGRAFRGRPEAAATAAVIACATIAFLGARSNREVTLARRADETGFVSKMLANGKWLREHFPPGSSIAVTTIGAIGYESRLVVIDMLGLTDRDVARNPQMFDGLEDSWREVKYNAESVLSREPDAIVFSTGVRPSSAAERALYLYRAFHDSYYALYYRTHPAQMSMRTVLVRRSDAPPFDARIVGHDGFEFIEEYILAHVEKGRHGNNEAALEAFEKAVRLGPPEFRAAREWYAVTAADLGREGAYEALVDVVENDAFAVVAMGRLGLMSLDRDLVDEALAIGEALTEANPLDNTGWAILAEAHRRRGEYEEALQHIIRAVDLSTTNGSQLLTLANIATHLGNLELSKRSLERLLSVSPPGPLADIARAGLAAVASVERGDLSLEELQRRFR